jgi:hypothetical protein
MKRMLVAVILLSMMLHCASRLGFVSFLYKYRQEIAYNIGLITEIPIALCNGDYDFNKGLSIQTHDTDEEIPGFPQAQEIKLFVKDKEIKTFHSYPLALAAPDRAHDVLLRYASPARSIFHPPS